MTFHGVDIGHIPSKTVLTSTRSPGWVVGERVWIGGQPNRFVTRIVATFGTSAEIVTHRRPTRGYARHIRRQKQRARR